jgi:hypothetical protein
MTYILSVPFMNFSTLKLQASVRSISLLLDRSSIPKSFLGIVEGILDLVAGLVDLLSGFFHRIID